MRLIIAVCFVVWTVVLATPATKNCPDDCMGYESCPIARTLLLKQEPAADNQLKEQFCGRNQATGIPKVCCSELQAIQEDPEENDEETSDSVENHPNLRLLPESCGHINGEKIIGGTVAGLYEYPWMVLISYYTRGTERGLEFKCGGSLINERYVLTAAHCVINRRIAGVRVGEHDYLTQEDCQGAPPKLTCESHVQDFRVEKEIPHPDFPRKQDDIALLRLQKPVNFNYKNAGAICLPVSDALRGRDIVGLHGIVAGWGLTEMRVFSSKLQAVDVPIATTDVCEQNTNFHNRFKGKNREDELKNKICAGRIGKDSCEGDSGGPLMLKGSYRNSGHRYIAYGIVSYGPPICGSGNPGVYTDVTKYMGWILENMQP